MEPAPARPPPSLQAGLPALSRAEGASGLCGKLSPCPLCLCPLSLWAGGPTLAISPRGAITAPSMDSLPSARARRHPAWLLPVAAALGAGVVVAALVWRGEAADAVDAVVTRLRDAGPAAFFGAMALLPAAGFPLMPFTLAAGPVFGPTLGPGGTIACAVLAVMVNVALSYGLAAGALRPMLARLFARWGYRVPEAGAATAWQVAAIVRLTPGPPFWLQSYVLGIARVAFVPYLVVSTLVPAGYIAGVVLGGDALYRGRANAAWFALGLIGLTLAALQLWRRRARREARGQPRAAAGPRA